jgi:hypothetical protein
VAPQQPREGVRLWSPIEDTRSAFWSWRHGELSVGAWLATLLHPLHFQLFARDDPKPSVLSVTRLARQGLRNLVARRR